MLKFIELVDCLKPLLKQMKNFKIGKTDKSIEELYKERYSDTYQFYEVVKSSHDSLIIDYFEEYMIEYYINQPNCDNNTPRGDEMKRTGTYIIYLVYND